MIGIGSLGHPMMSQSMIKSDTGTDQMR